MKKKKLREELGHARDAIADAMSAKAVQAAEFKAKEKERLEQDRKRRETIYRAAFGLEGEELPRVTLAYKQPRGGRVPVEPELILKVDGVAVGRLGGILEMSFREDRDWGYSRDLEVKLDLRATDLEVLT